MVTIWRSGPFTLGDRAPAALGPVKALILTASWEITRLIEWSSSDVRVPVDEQPRA